MKANVNFITVLLDDILFHRLQKKSNLNTACKFLFAMCMVHVKGELAEHLDTARLVCMIDLQVCDSLS